MTSPKRVTVAVRLRPESVAQIDKIADGLDWDRSQLLRNLIVLGLRAWAKGER